MRHTQQTPLPWHVSENGWKYPAVASGPESWPVLLFVATGNLRSDEVNKANAEFICRAVNSHAALVAALQALGAKPDGYCFCRTPEDIQVGHTGECRDAQAALKLAAVAAEASP